MSKLIRSVWRRIVTRYNVERRAEKVLDRKPVAAPKYTSDVAAVKQPDAKVHERDAALLTRLEQISVQQAGGDPDLPKPIGRRDKLPQRAEAQPRREARSKEDVENFGMFANEHVPPGRINLKQLLAMLNDANAIQAREKWQKVDEEKRKRVGEELAERYKLDATAVATLTEFLGLFMVHVPESQKQRVQVEPAQLRSSPFSKMLETDVSLKRATQKLPPKTRLAGTDDQAGTGESAARERNS